MMSRTIFSSRVLVAVLITVAAVVWRVLEIAPNVSPIAAMALLSGATFAWPWSLLAPLAAQVAADAVIGFDEWAVTAAVYASFLLTVLLGRAMRVRRGAWRILGASLASSILFYLITNAAVWLWSGMYATSLDGLITSYYFAIPFFRNMLFGDMVFSFSFFLALEYVPAACRFLYRLTLAWWQKTADGVAV